MDNDTEGSSKRLPMNDISNKLHAMVDEFVCNLSSKCDSLSTKVTDKNHELGEVNVGLTAATARRPISRTPSDILQGLKKPGDVQSTLRTEADGSLQRGQRRQGLDARSMRTSSGGECMAVKPLEDWSHPQWSHSFYDWHCNSEQQCTFQAPYCPQSDGYNQPKARLSPCTIWKILQSSCLPQLTETAGLRHRKLVHN